MTDWDERFRQLQEESQKATGNAHAAEVERRLQFDEASAKFHSAVKWAVNKYRSSGIAPWPVYVAWVERGRVPRFSKKKPAVERKSRKIGDVYPLCNFSRDARDYNDWYMAFARADGMIIEAKRSYPGDPSESVVYEWQRADPKVPPPDITLEAFEAPLDQLLKAFNPYRVNVAENVDKACSAVVQYVAQRIEPNNR